MTNIYGVLAAKDKNAALPDLAICMADSMASGDNSKHDGAQKLFAIGKNKNYLLMGTGFANPIIHTGLTLRDAKIESLTEAYKAIVDVVQAMPGINPTIPANFIVAGMEPINNGNAQLGIMHVNATGHPKLPREGKNAHKKRIARWFGSPIMDGSGGQFAANNLNMKNRFGIPTKNDRTSAFANAYEACMDATQSSGVNENLQIGLLSSDGVALLYHPNVFIQPQEAYTDILNRISKLNIPAFSSKLDDIEARLKFTETRINISKFLGAFYDSLISDLRDYRLAKNLYTQYSELSSEDSSIDPLFIKAKNNRIGVRENLSKGLDALISYDMNEMVSYVNNYNSRITQGIK